MKGSVELHDAVFALEQKQGVSFPENAMRIPLVKLGHRLESIQESSALLSDKMDCPRGSATQESDQREVVEDHQW
jgi:hypothetical protein